MRASILSRLTFIGLLVTFSASVFAEANSYVGYYYYGYAGSPPPNGVAGSILTLSRPISGTNFYCQWVCVKLNYANNYWLQVGYNQGYDSTPANSLQWFTEKNDVNGYQIWWKTAPTYGTTYAYYIQKTNGGSTWTLSVTSQFSQSIIPSPYTAVDYQAMSEATTTVIVITGTHFSGLQYKATNNNWYPFDQHYPRQDYPYTLTETSNTEFYASGGG